MRGIAIVGLGGSACGLDQPTKDTRQAHVQALAEASVSVATGADGQLHATLDFPGGAYSKTCTLLAPDVQATWGGVPVTTIARGDVGPPGADACDLPVLTLPPLDATFAGLDSMVDLTIFDGTNEVHMVAVGPLAPRKLAADGGKIVPDATAVVRWTSTTDHWLSVNAKDGGDGIKFECDDPTTLHMTPVFDATTVSSPWTPLTVNGDVFTFHADEYEPYTGTMSCMLSAIAYAEIAQCDLADCEYVTTVTQDSLDYYLFTLEQ
jgi:hypothetical protein